MSHSVMGVSEDLVVKCGSTMLHDNIYISRFMVNPNHLRRLDLRGRIDSIRGTMLMKGVLPRVVLRFKKILGLKICFLTKFFVNFLT